MDIRNDNCQGLTRADIALPASMYAHIDSRWTDGGDDSIWLNQVVGTVWRGKLGIAGLIAIGVLVGVIATIAKSPVYRARTTLQLEGFNEGFLREASPILPVLANASVENYIRNQLNVLQSDTLARRVADELGIVSLPPSHQPVVMPTAREWARRIGLVSEIRRSGDEERIARVRASITARLVPQSQTIVILYDAADPETAAKGANTVAAEFIAFNRETRWKIAEDTTEWLGSQAADLKAKLEANSRKLQEYARSSGMIFAGGEQTLAHDRVRQLQIALARAEEDRAAKQSRYEAALANSGEKVPAQLMTEPLRQCQAELQNLRRQRAELTAVYTPAYPKVLQLDAQIAELEAGIKREKRAIIDLLKTEYDAAMRLEVLLERTNARQLEAVEAQGEKEAHYKLLKREVESTQQLYDAMFQKAREAGAASAMRATNIRVIDPARAPVRPNSPNLAVNIAVGIAFGLISGVGLAFFRERAGIVRQPGDAKTLNIPVLGVIPSIRHNRWLTRFNRVPSTLRASGLDGSLVTLQNEVSVVSESFRAALASILLSSRGQNRIEGQGGVLIVSSTDAMEGKTTVLANLGIALAQTKRRVLLIDADLRRPRLHEMFDIPNDWGLTDLVRGRGGIESMRPDDLVRPTCSEDLWLLPSGLHRDHITKTLYSANLISLLRRFRAEFDLVLVDTPPLMMCPDGRILGSLSDGVVLVLRADRARTDALRETCTRLMQDGIPVLGTILNDWNMDRSRFRTYHKYYR